MWPLQSLVAHAAAADLAIAETSPAVVAILRDPLVVALEVALRAGPNASGLRLRKLLWSLALSKLSVHARKLDPGPVKRGVALLLLHFRLAASTASLTVIPRRRPSAISPRQSSAALLPTVSPTGLAVRVEEAEMIRPMVAHAADRVLFLVEAEVSPEAVMVEVEVEEPASEGLLPVEL